MSKQGINRVTLIGNLGHDPESYPTKDGKTVTKIQLATSESWQDENGKQVTRTEWHNVVFFNGLADVAKNYLVKGSKVYIEGKLKSHKWQDQEGKERTSTDIIVQEMQMLSGAKKPVITANADDADSSDIVTEYRKAAKAAVNQANV